MKLYLIGGLGADERVFKYLKLNNETQVIHWIKPEPDEELKDYAKRLLNQINQNEEFGLLGVSFGGIIANELTKLVQPQILILISSVETSSQLPRKYVSIGKTRILNIIPDSLIKPPNHLLGFLFGAQNKELLKQIIRDTNPGFIRWALNSIIKWSNEEHLINTVRIHGTNDILIPLKGNAIKVKDGGHFMIVDKAKEISNLINEQMDMQGNIKQATLNE